MFVDQENSFKKNKGKVCAIQRTLAIHAGKIQAIGNYCKIKYGKTG